MYQKSNEKLKSITINIATPTIEGIGSVFDSSKLKKQEKEILKLKTENTNN